MCPTAHNWDNHCSGLCSGLRVVLQANDQGNKRDTKSADDGGYLCKKQYSVGDAVSNEWCRRLQQEGYALAVEHEAMGIWAP